MLNQLTKLLIGSGNQFLTGGLGLMVIGVVGAVARKVPAKCWSWFLRYGTVVLDVQSTDRAYDWLVYWLDTHSYSKKTRRISIRHVRTKTGESKTIVVPAKGEHLLFYKHRPVWLSRFEDGKPGNSTGGLADVFAAMNARETITLRMFGRSKDLMHTLIDEAEKLFNSSDETLLKINRWQWGGWQKRRKGKRPLASVFFPENGMGLLEDMRAFISQRSWYEQMGIPYRRGYLFHGPPGTGKSSAAEALAGELGITIFSLNLAGRTDSELEQAISQIDSDGTALLLIEDVDTTALNREASQTQRISLGTLLNALDGLNAAENIILIMTSNNPEALDKALLRKGRVDSIVEFGMASEEQIRSAVHRFLPTPTLAQNQEIASWPRPITMADVQEHLKGLTMRCGGNP